MLTRSAKIAVGPLVAAALVAAPMAQASDQDQAVADRKGTRTLFGSAVQPNPGESFREARVRLDRQFGHMQTVRYFDPNLPNSWKKIRRDAGRHRPVVVSFKAPPKAILSGDHDRYLRHWFAKAPKHRRTWWSYLPEPEDAIEGGQYSARQFRKAWRHLDRLAKAGPKKLRSTLVLMTYTLNPYAHRNWRDYFPGRRHVDVMGWDGYNWGHKKGIYAKPATFLRRAVKVSKKVDKPWGLAETGSVLVGSDDGARRAKWLKRVGKYAARRDAKFVTYFNADVGVDYRLHDRKSQRAWKNVIDRLS